MGLGSQSHVQSSSSNGDGTWPDLENFEFCWSVKVEKLHYQRSLKEATGLGF